MVNRWSSSSDDDSESSDLGNSRNNENRVAQRKRLWKKKKNADDKNGNGKIIRKRQRRKMKLYKSKEYVSTSEDEEIAEMVHQAQQLVLQQIKSTQNVLDVPHDEKENMVVDDEPMRQGIETGPKKVEANIPAEVADEVIETDGEVMEVTDGIEIEEDERPLSTASSVICLGEMMPLKFKNPIRHVYQHVKISLGPQRTEPETKLFTGIVEDTKNTLIVPKDPENVEELNKRNITTFFVEMETAEGDEETVNDSEKNERLEKFFLTICTVARTSK